MVHYNYAALNTIFGALETRVFSSHSGDILKSGKKCVGETSLPHENQDLNTHTKHDIRCFGN